MRIFSQTKLLLWKNLVLRYRRPGILVLEVLWPILVVGIIAVMRLAVPPTKTGNCHYQPRALPSSGAIPFLQTYICNLNNPCFTSDVKINLAYEASQEFSAMTGNLGPLLGSDEIIDVLEVSNKTSNVYTMIKKAVGSKELLHGLENIMNVSSYFRDPDKVKSILVGDYNLLTEPEADALMKSRIDVGQLMSLTGSPDFKDIACDAKKLDKYVQFPAGADVEKLSESLCNVTEDKTVGLANLMIRELNMTSIFNAMKLMEEVKESFLDEHNILSYSFEMIAQMFEVVTDSKEVMKLLGTFAGIPDIASFIRKIPEFVGGFQDFDSIMTVLKDVVFNLEPLMKNLGVDNSPIWLTVKDAARLGANFMELTNDKWNGTSEEFMQPLKSLLTNIEDMAHDEEGQMFIAFFEFLTKIDMVKAYDEVIYKQGLTESTIKTMLTAMQEMFEKMSVWESMKPMVRINEHLFDVIAILSEKSVDLKHALKSLFDSNDVLKKEIKKIFAYGPEITHTVLDAFVNNDIFTAIANEEMYDDICRRALTNLQSQIPFDVYQDVRNTLCPGTGDDVVTEINKLLKNLKLSAISKVINETVIDFEKLYEGEFFRSDVQLVDIYGHYTRLTNAFNSYINDDYKWFQVFEGVYMDDIDFNERGWEPVTDMLDENFLTTLTIGSFHLIGKAFANSPLADEFAPTIHVMSEMVKLVYETLTDVNELTARDTPLMQLANMVTKYSPEIVNGVTHLLDTNNDMMFKLLASEDPLKTFCDDKFLYKMALPDNVPITELNNLVCKSDWNRIVDDMALPAKRIEAFIPKMRDIVNMDHSQIYNIETDWIQIEDYSERLFDMISMGQILGVIDMRTTTVEFFGQLDLSRMDETLDSFNRLMMKMMTEDTMMVMEIAYKFISMMDVQSSEDMSLSDMFKASMVTYESYLDRMIESMKNPKGLDSMVALLSGLPPSVRDMVILMSKAYPQFVSAAADNLYDPSKITTKILALRAANPNCETTFVSDYLSLARDSDFYKFEAYLCQLNFTEFIEDLFMSQFSIFMGGNEMTSNGSKVLADVDWQRLQEKNNEFNNLIMSESENLAMSPFNTTAINIAWDKFYMASDTLAKLGSKKVEHLIEDVLKILSISVDDSNDPGLENFFYGSMYLSGEFTRAIINELSVFNTSSPVILVDHLGSKELKKLTDLLVVSPDVNAVGVATLYRLLSSPQKTMLSMDFEAMCRNLTLFSEVFVVSASPMNPADLQSTICNALTTINITLMFEQLADRPMFQTIENAIQATEEQNIAVMKQGYLGSVENAEKLSELIEKIERNPPTIKLTSSDDVWMDAEMYAREWENLGRQLGHILDDSMNGSLSEGLGAIVSRVAVESLRSLPEAPQIFGYIDAFVDIAQNQIDSSADFFQRYNKYPGTSVVIDLMNHAPGAIQTVLYTVLRQSQKLGEWTNALQSWQSFCATPADTIFTVPPGLQFSMSGFKNKMCSIDGEQLLHELGEAQKADKLESLFSGDSDIRGNATITEEKLRRLVESFTQEMTSISEDDLARSFNLRLFNETVWEDVSKRVVTWMNDTVIDFMSPEKISLLVASTLQDTIGGMSPEAAEMINKGMAVADVVIGELLGILKSNSLDEAFQDLPSMQPFIYLLNSVPELFETILYTGTVHPEKISMKLQTVQSFEDFCANNPEEMFTMPPQSSFDAKQWMGTLCSINETLLNQFLDYKTATHIQDIIENSLNKSVDINELMDKTNKLIDTFTHGIPLNERVFDADVWRSVMEDINSWMAGVGTDEQIFSTIERSVSSGVIVLLQSMPESSEALHYIDAILDIVGDRIDSSRADIKKAFDGFPTIMTLLELLEQSPEIIETVLYTVMTQPEKTTAWTSAMQSWARFCSTPSADIMKVPSGSKFDVSAFLAKMCTVDVNQLITELNTYQSAERIKMISMGNDTAAFNASSMMEKFNKLFESVEHISMDPMGDNVPDLRLLNTTVWNQLGMRMEQWMNEAGANYGSEASIVNMINQVYMSTLAQMPEAKDVFTKILAITGVITDQTMDYLQSGYINSTLGDSPTLQNLVNLAENVPELLEVLVYTGLKHPDKLSSAANSFMSLEDFCRSSPENLFTLPPEVNFDLTGWLTQLCTLNLTDVEKQLVEQKSAKDIEAIIMGTSGSDVNIASVVGKIDELMKLFEDGPTFHDRFLDASVWSKAMSRVQGWMEDPDFINSNSMMSYVSGVFSVIDQLQQQPGMNQVLQPLSVAMQIVDNMMYNILQLSNKTSIQGKDLFAGWQGMVNTLKFIQTPGVLDSLFASAGDYKKFMPLTSEEGLKDFCDPNTSPKKYLTIPADSSVDIQKVKTAFCDINFDRYMDGVDSFIDFKTLEGISNGSLTFDWKAFEGKLDRFSDLLMKWEKQPPTFNLPPHWMDENYWNTLFESSLSTLPEKMTAKEQIVSLVTQLGPLLDTEGFKQVGMILNKVLDILNFNIKSLQDTRLTLGSLIESVPALKNLFDAVGVNSETLRSVALAPIKNTEQFMQLFVSNNVQNDFCNTDKWTKAIDFPASFNTSGLVETICGGDPQAILARMEDNFQLTDTLKTLMDNTPRLKDWTEATGKIFDLVDNLELLIKNPPSLNADETLSILSVNYNMTNLFELTSVFSVLGQLFNKSDNGGGFDDVMTQTSSQLENIVGMVIGVLDSVLGRVMIQDGRLDIAALFKNVPEVQAIIKGILGMKPDPLTGLFSVILRADKISDFISMSGNPSKLRGLFCDKPTFERVFQIRNGVDVDRLLTALCKVNFDQVGDELKNSFLPSDDMASGFDVEAFSKHMENVISQLTNVTILEHVVFNGTDLANIFVLNSTRLMEIWDDSNFGDVPEDYVALATQILNTVLNEMDSSSGDVKTLAASFKFMTLYLESFNSFLRSIKEKPIHLSMLLNNTEVGAILNPILTNLHSLNALVDMTVDLQKLDELIEGPSPLTALCNDDLFQAFRIPANEMAPFKDLQSRVCSTNSSVLLWQTVMMQANGYFLHQQLEMIEKELSEGKTSINTTAVAVNMEEMVSLMQTIIGQYVDGSRSFSDLIDVNKIKGVLENTQKNIADKLLVSSQEWSLQLADIVLPKVLDQSSLLTISKTLNTVNLFMNFTIAQLHGMNDGRIDVSDFFMRADGLQHIVEAYIRLAVNISQAWSNNEFDVNKMQHLFNDTSMINTYCKHGGIAQYIAHDSTPSQTVMDFSTVVCSIMGAAMSEDVKAIIGYNEVGDLLMTIWEDTQAKPDYTTLVRNVQTFTSLIQELSSKSNQISTSLLDVFHIEDALDSLQNIAQNPQKIFQVLKLLGMAIDDPLSHDTEALKSLSQMNSFVLMPMVRFLEALKAKGLTLTSMADNPNAFLDMMSVLADFDFQFASIKEFVVKPRISTLSRYKDELCRFQYNRDSVKSLLAMLPNLPVSVDDVLSIICTHNSSTWMDEFQQMGFTNTEMVVLLDKLTLQANVFDMYVDPFKWTDLMSSLEKLSALISDSGIKSGSKMDDVKSAWNATRDILFDKGFTSLFSYLDMLEISAPPMDSDWIVFKQFMRFLTSTMETIDRNVQRVADKGQVIQLKDALPDPQRVADVFARIMGGESAAEFLATAVDPVMFFRLSVYNSWEEICKNKGSIVNYFQFPDGTDVDSLTNSLCYAVITRTAAFEEMLSLFGAKDMFKQLDMLIHREWNASDHNSVYDHTHAAMMHLIKTLEKVQHSRVDAGNMEAYFQPIIMVLKQQQQQSFGMCNSIVGYLNKTRDYNYFHDIFSRVFTSLNLVSDLAKIIPSMDDLACSLNDENEISLKKFINKLVGLGFIESVEQAVKDLILPPSELQCSAPLSFSVALMEVINATVENNELDTGRIHRCTEDTSVKFRKILSSATGLLDFIKQLVGAMQTPSIQGLLNDPQLMTAFNFFSNAIDNNANRMIKFEDLLINKTLATTYLTNSLAIPRSVATAIMNSTVNPSSINFLRQSEDVIERTLCDPSLLSKTLIVPGPDITASDISRIICGNRYVVADTVNYLKNVSTSPKQVAEDSGLMTIVADLTNGLADLVTNFDGIIRLFVDLSTKQDINVMEGHADVIDNIIQGNVMERFGESLKKIFHAVKPFFSQDASTQDVIHDVENVIDGIIAIEVVVKGPIVETLEVEDLVLNVTSLKMFLKNELKFSPELTDTILHSVFSARVFFGLEDKQAYSCDEVFDMLLVMNGTDVSPSEVSKAFCQLNEKELTDLSNSLKMELDIGKLIAKYVSYTTNSVMASTNMTKEELNDMVNKIDKSQVVIQQATDEFKKFQNGSRILDIFGDASADAFTSLDKLTPIMCGESMDTVFDKGLKGSVIVTSPDSFLADIHSGVDHNVDDLPNDFCVDIYKNIRSSALGSIIWAYVKPIMRGKILYTPDNEITRAIIQKANDTFKTLDEVNRIASIWAKQAPNLETLTVPVNDTEGLRDALENDFIKGLLESTVGVEATDVLTGLDALQSNNFDKEDLTALQSLAEIVANYTSCIDLNRFVPLATEKDLEIEAFRLSKTDTFWAGIVFEIAGKSTPTSGRRKRQSIPIFPKHISYKIRMDVDNVMDTTRLKSGLYTMAAEDSFIEDLRYLRGFIYIQDILDSSIIDFHKDPDMKTPGVKIRQMPFPCHHYDGFIFMLGSYLIPIMMTFVFLASIGTATHNLTYDRENGQEQTLSVMGMMSGLNFMSWFITTMAIMTVVCGVLAIMLKYTDIFIYSNPFIIFLFLLTFCFSSVNLLYMISAFFNRTTLAILFVLMVYLISYLPFILVVSLELTMEPWQKNLACLASTTAFSFGSHNMGYLEDSGKGAQWSNIKEEGAKDYSMHWACMMMLIDSAIYLVIGLYVRHVKPGKYGVPKSWYFPILPSFWCGCFNCGPTENKYLAPKNPEHSKGSLFEAAPPDHEVGIEVNNLSKAYGKTKALHDLTIDFYEGQISCLLGHNGAAKTTTLKLFCGVLEPTTGSVLLNGRKPGSGNHSLGVCPQQNALFNYMSVLEHMEFYSEMKGARVTLKRMQEIKKLLKDVDLWHVRNVSTGDLSYGMKRRLCVALAFVGESKTVILDEPTSGVDPHARKNIWNLISSNRHGRTILLSTHHLDEADILGDRIAILHKGRLLCSGSPSFLKRQMGGGYKLTISKSINSDAKEQNVDGTQPDVGDSENSASDKSSIDASILSYIQTMCPTARISESMGTEMVVDLPKDENLINVSLPVFFQDLDRRAKDLDIANYGLTDTKVEDIFLQLTLDMEKNDQGVDNPAMVPELDTSVSIPNPTAPLSSAEQQQSVDTKKRRTGAKLGWSQLAALLVKRFHHYRRNWRMLITCVILPLIAFMIAIGFSSIRPDEGDQRPLVVDPVIYGEDSYTFLSLAEEVLQSDKAVKLANSFRNSSIGIGTSCMANTDEGDWVVNPSCEKGSAPYGIQKPLYSVSCAEAVQEYTIIKGFQVNYQQQDLPNEVYLQNLDRHNIPRFILKTFRDFKDKRFGGWSLEEAYEKDDPAEYNPYVWFNSKGYHAMPSFLSGLSNSILRANLPSYENPDEYGITTINHPIRLGRSPLTLKTLENDAADAGISVMVVLAFSFIPCGFILYIINERNQKEKQLQQISGVGTFMYWMVSWLWDMFVYLIAVGVSVAIVAIFEIDSFYIRDNLFAFAVTLIMYGWAMIPYIYLVSRFFKSASSAYLVTFCSNLFLAMATIISLLVMQLFREDDVIWKCYKICRYAFLVFPQFALGQGLMDMVSSTVKYKLFLRFDEDLYDNPFEYDITGYKLIAMAIFGFVFFVLNLLAEKIHGRALRISKKHSETSSEIDDDVAKEKDRVRQSPRGDLLQVNDLSKVYRRGWKKFAAVDHINFGIQEGESFGLLGVNGAGKTTTFRMLTGDLGSSGGTVMFNGRKISSHDRHFGQSVGYCPQEGGLDQYLTGRETLHFHARLRGFDGEQSKQLVDQHLSRLGLEPYAKKAVHTYSEGTKRKLALAVAMLGDPPILYLDEPTTGMDAATRRQAWKCIAQANLNGQSVILTSHTMDECDALCGRIAIMVNGQIKCIGSPQHLKNKFGDGYTAVVHSQKDNLGGVSHFFLNHFPGSLIRTKHHSSLEIMIPHSCGILADILAVLQRSQQEGMIEYYSLSQTTLDAVFISFAQDQTDTFEEGTVTNSSIEDKSFTPRSSVSYDNPPSYDGQSSDKKDSPYVFSNPQFVLNEDESEIPGETARPRYVSNITLAAEMAPVPTSDEVTSEDFSTRM